MSDAIDSLGMIFDTTADTSASAGLLDSMAGVVTDGGDTSVAATDAAITNAEATSGAAPPAEQAPPEPPTLAETTGDSQPGAPVSEGSTPIPANAAASGATWFKSLSPAAQGIIGKGIAGGAAGVLNALAQKNILDEKKREINQAREDVQRKGQVTAFSDGAFKPKGVIDGVRGA